MKRGDLYPMVVGLLMEHPLLRDDDNLLEVEVCRKWNDCFDQMDATSFVYMRDTLGFPSRESIGRIRRLVQQNIPELQASEGCVRKRVKLEDEWKEFTRNG